MSIVQLKVSGDYALFTRPESKVERVSYPIMTPSAARGVLESILWKPEMGYEIIKIKVLKEPTYLSMVRNEVSAKAPGSIKSIEKPFYVDDKRQLRHSLFLKDVTYIIEARIYVKEGSSQNEKKYVEMFKRRAGKGQCFRRPYLGTRECAAQFSLPTGEEEVIDWTETLGIMFYDFDYGKKIIPQFFNAKIESGVMEIPKERYQGV